MNEQTAAKIRAEQERLSRAWGRDQFATMALERCLALLMEEIGEVATCVIELPRHPGEPWRQRLEEELVQVAAVACQWLDDCISAPLIPEEAEEQP